MPLPNPERQRTARDSLAQIFAHRETVYAIHYACQSFYSGEQLASTRIGCIAVRQLASGQVTTFSIAKTAELYRLAEADIASRWNALERTMLGEFYEFVRTNKGARFVHWNMRDDTFGFAALEHRFQVLGGKPEPIAEHNRIDVARLLVELYGDRIVRAKNKLDALSRLNGFAMADVLFGAEEAAALQAGQYRRVQMSTQTKVKLIADIANRANDRTLKTQAGFVANHGGPLRLMLQKAIDNPGYTLASGLAGGFLVMLKAYDWLFGG
jgi:hypothetical protein